VRDNLAQLAHHQRRHPHLGDHPHRQQLGQPAHIVFIGLDNGSPDQLDVRGMCHHHLSGIARHLIIDRPRVGAGLDHRFISGFELGP